MEKDILLAFRDVSMHYDQGAGRATRILEKADLELRAATSMALVGPSGSGKSTLLHLAAGILTPTAGRIFLAGREISNLSENQRTVLRRDSLGLVFQFFHLLPHLSVAENIALPAWVAGVSMNRVDERLTHLLERVGLADRRDDAVGKLSGGEMQRIAICRALLLKPRVVLADEPTGSLDEKTGGAIMDLLLELVADEGGSLLYVTHDKDLAARAAGIWRLHQGRVVKEARP
ncbi:ABC transporter ATP-binding protein [bacterium DOLJORAL78_65_58]|nr:MAG: ABC transporter ATP-binding protein [bacterium DOLZORAL124_64_63]PIE75583.1 MAG: ABC transporter ATP-binding protein [bacterium DOLJORAL78_65_58]